MAWWSHIPFIPFSKGTPSGDMLGIELGGTVCKCVHMRRAGQKFEVLNLLSRPCAGIADDELVKIVRSAAGSFGLKSPSVIAVVPASAVITKNIEVPSTSPQEIREIINLQAGRHTPYSREEIIVDYLTVGTYKHSYTKIVLVIVARQVVRRLYEVIEKTGLSLEHVVFTPEAFGITASELLTTDTAQAPAAIVHVDEGASDFVVVANGKPVFVRAIPLGARMLSEDPRHELRFAEEVRNSLEAYASEDIERAPLTVALTGSTEGCPGLVSKLSEAVRLPVHVVAYYKGLTLSNEVFTRASGDSHVSYFSVIAALASSGRIDMDLVPEEVKMRRQLQERGRDLIAAGILVLTACVLVFIMLVTRIFFGAAYIRKLDTQYRPMLQEAASLEQEFERVGRVKGYLNKRGFSLEVLTALYDLASDTLQLSDIRFDDQGKFSVKGTADAMATVFTFVENMEKSKYFADVKTKYTTKRKEAGVDVTDFEVTCTVTKPPHP